MLFNIVFRLLNFSILASLFYYVIKQTLIPFFMNMMKEYDIFINNLSDDVKNISNDSKAITQETNDQELLFQVMQTKFILWQKKCYQQQQLLIHEQELIDRAIKSRFDMRSHVVNDALAIKEQLPYILDRVTVTLQKKYHNIEYQKKYITDLIHVMKERS